MKKILFKIALMAVMLVLLALAVPAQAATISVGNDPSASLQIDSSSSGFCIFEAYNLVSADGWLTSFQYYASNNNRFRFLLVDQDDMVQWVSGEILPPGIGVNTFTPESPVPVKMDWYLGVYFVSTGAIPFIEVGLPSNYYIPPTSDPPLPTLPSEGSIITSGLWTVNRTYSFGATGVTVFPPQQTVSVTIAKYLNGAPADATSAKNASFIMNATSGTFNLGPEGVNNPNPYQATFAGLTSGAAYSLSEDTSPSSTVGTTCNDGKPYQLLGYTTGDWLAQAVEGNRTSTPPNLTNITSNKVIIVWNKICGQPDVLAGNDTDERTILYTNSNFTVIDTNRTVSADGWLTSFQYYASNQNPFRFLLVDGFDMVQWVSDEITPPEMGVNTFKPMSPVPVQQGWYLGAYFVSACTIPFERTGAPAYYSSSGSGFPLSIVGRTLTYTGGESATYSFAATGETVVPPPETVNATVVKYLDGERANEVSANKFPFPMNELWSAANLNAGSGSFVLGPTGVNTSNSYEARTPYMTTGAFYSVSEDTSQGTVGTTCNKGQLYRLAGYTTGDTLVQAVLARQVTKAPSLNDIVGNKYVIVWNETCATDDDDDECDDHDNGHHYGNDKGDNHHHPKDKCKKRGDKGNGNYNGTDKTNNGNQAKKK